MKALDKIFLSFQIGNDIFAVDALKVDHILELPSHITKVPNTPEYLLGIINLHGNIIPVADMRVIMHIEEIINGTDTSIIVLNPTGNQDAKIGILVDSVREVIETSNFDLKETILEGNKGLLDSFEGTFIRNDQFIHVIDINNLTEIIEQ